ncbi:MAG: carbohydrate kinase family protein [Nanoarchaeota archaeon]|nr:carbohydrate kinase family protein [Nanoarchaeota archaeon]
MVKFEVVSFGSAVVDAFVDTEFNKVSDSFNYPAGSKILVDDLKFDIGGGATNVAVAFARLGLKTGCICKIGDDNNGQDVLNMLNKENIKFLGSETKGKTGYSIILDSKDRSRTILTFKGPGNDIGLSEVPKFKTDWLYFSSVLGKSLKTQEKLARKLKKEGTRLAFNPGEYLIKRENLTSILKLCDVLILNKEEAEMLCKKYKKEGNLMVCLRELGPKIVIITDKNNLISCSDGNKNYFLKPNKVKVVERTGAGDAFASGFVAGVIARKTIPESLKLGLKESESVIRYFGAKNKLLKFKLK